MTSRVEWRAPVFSRASLLCAMSIALGCTSCGPVTMSEDPVPGIAADAVGRMAQREPCTPCEASADRAGVPLYLHPEPLIVASDVSGIEQTVDPQSGTPGIRIDFMPASQAKIAAVTRTHVGKLFAWVTGGQVVMSAYVSGEFSESMQATGLGTLEDQHLTYRLLTGTRPAP